MSFIVEKCTVMNIGTQNRKSDYLIAEQHLTEMKQQRELVILKNNDLK